MSDETRPILFLDIDGVVSIFGLRGEMSAEREFMIEIPVPVMKKRLERTPALIFDTESQEPPEVSVRTVFLTEGIEERLQALDEAFEIIWCTGWLQTANHLLTGAEIELGPFESLAYRDSKLEAILLRAGGRPWAFVDDEIYHDLRITPGFVLPANAILVETPPETGLTDEHVSELLAFARITSSAAPGLRRGPFSRP